jgi:hypothetical protein
MAAQPLPLILRDADILFGPTPGDSLKCVCEHLELSPDTATTTVTTMCGETDYAGATKWSLVATFVQSFDTGATEEVLSAIVDAGDPVPFTIIPYGSQAVSATNPAWQGEAIPKPYAPINGDAGDQSVVEIEWGLTGPPTKTITPPVAAGASAKSSG